MESVVVRTAASKIFHCRLFSQNYIIHKYILDCLLYVMILCFPSCFKSVSLMNSSKLNLLKHDRKDHMYIIYMWCCSSPGCALRRPWIYYADIMNRILWGASAMSWMPTAWDFSCQVYEKFYEFTARSGIASFFMDPWRFYCSTGLPTTPLLIPLGRQLILRLATRTRQAEGLPCQPEYCAAELSVHHEDGLQVCRKPTLVSHYFTGIQVLCLGHVGWIEVVLFFISLIIKLNYERFICVGLMNSRVTNGKQEWHPFPLVSGFFAWWRYDERIGMTKYGQVQERK
jgi:hypothetical protein